MPDAESSPAGLPPPGFRLPDSSRIGCVRLQVADLERSLAFYRDLMGCLVVDRHGPWGGKRATLAARDGASPLIELREKRSARPVPRRGLLGLYHFAILLPSREALGAFITRADAAGLKPGMADHGYSQSLYINDPDGLGVEIYADQPRETWVYRDREIIGRVEPLDVEPLVVLGETVTWSGMPAGSTIGHVHLFVGDLEAGARFYHAGLGFDKVGWSFPGALFVSAGGYHHHIGMNTWAAGAPPATDDDARLLEWELLVPEPARVAENLRRLDIDAIDDGGSFVSRDAWGTPVRITTPGA